jgi:hypothetical protein
VMEYWVSKFGQLRRELFFVAKHRSQVRLFHIISVSSIAFIMKTIIPIFQYSNIPIANEVS